MHDDSGQSPPEVRDRRPLIVLTWLWVGAPLAYGLYELVRKASQLFTG
ncbi:MFS transporter small subunit [Streptomyces sp. VB1]